MWSVYLTQLALDSQLGLMRESKTNRLFFSFLLSANEICDRFATAGSHANLISYLTQELNMPLVQASNTLTNFGGTSSFTSLIGALIADSLAGRFWTITGGSIIYEMVSGKAPAPPHLHFRLLKYMV